MTIRTGILYLVLLLSLVSCGGGGSTTTNTATTSPSGTLVANAGADQNVLTGAMVRLDGSASKAADGGTLTYTWSMLSLPAGSHASLSDPAVVNPTFVADLNGQYDVKLVVNDGGFYSASANVTVTAATANLPPIANAGKDQNVITGSSLRLDGSGSTDANGDALTYSWTILSAPSGSSAVLSDPAATSPTFTADRDGNYVIRLVVNDGTVDSAPDTVTITAAAKDIDVSVGTFGASFPETYPKWWGGVRGPDGKIYGIPYSANDFLIIDPATNTATRRAMGADLTGSSKWASGCLGPDGKIYGVPYDAPDVLVIDPAAGTAVRTDFGLDLSDSEKWAGAVLGRDGKIYCMPRNATDILIIDPASGTATRSAMGADLSGNNKFSGGILAPDGKIYGVPRDGQNILVINPATGTASRSTMGAPFTSQDQYADGILAANGKIYAIPYTDAPNILIIDPAAGKATLSSMGANLSGSGWSEAVLGPDGRIYAVPYTAPDLLIIDPAAGTAMRRSIDGVGATTLGKWVMGDIAGATFYGIPYGSQDIIRVELAGGG